MGKFSWPTVAVVNTAASGVSDADGHVMAQAVAIAAIEDFSPRWGLGARFVFVPSTSKPPAGTWQVALLSTSDEAGALGYHDLTPDGLPLGKVFCQTDRQYGQQLSVTLSHEVLEMLADPWINLCAQANDGRFFALEVCDAVEADRLGYEAGLAGKGLGVRVSAFVLPAWFGHGAGELTYPTVAAVRRPLQLAPGGYISMFDPSSGRGWTQASEDHARKAELARLNQPVDRLALQGALPRVGSRRERRFRGRGRWVPSQYELG